ncbi:sugar transferase [bacterium]|jgi:lipopolysaccharide/colanic/teichoic acid biosynthesis glycosyltransferase|nr:sugar transferase [bacterium]
MYQNIKVISDIALAILLLVIILPILLITSLTILISMGRPVLFTQKRGGVNGIVFNIYKFRTMNNKKDTKNKLLPDNQRLTFIGNIIRKTSLDELPQLLNIVKGNMSFIGPRPLLASYIDKYPTWAKKRHSVKPGITGLAQVKGRNSLSWNDKFKFDISYIENLSLKNDIIIIFLTIKVILFRKNINQTNSTPMKEYLGE